MAFGDRLPAGLRKRLSRSKPQKCKENVHNLLGLHDCQLRIPRHDPVVIVRRIPEHQIPNLIRLPRMHKRDVARNRRLHDISPSVELSRLLLVSMDLHSVGATARVVLDRYLACLYFCAGAGWGVDDGVASCVGVESGNERALGDELDADVTVEVGVFEEFVSENVDGSVLTHRSPGSGMGAPSKVGDHDFIQLL